MIHSFYHHGEDQPATGLSRAQVIGALHDAAGIVWLDLAASDAETARDMLENVVRLDPDAVALAAPWITRSGPVPPPWHGLALTHSRGIAFRLPAVAGSVPARTHPRNDATQVSLEPVAGFFGVNYLVTVHQRDVPILAAYRETVTEDAALMELGADNNVARLLWSMLRSYAEALDRLAPDLGDLESSPWSAGRRRDLHRVQDDLDRLSLGLAAVESAAGTLGRDSDMEVGDAARARFRTVSDQARHYQEVSRKLGNRCATLQTRYDAGRLVAYAGVLAAFVAFGVSALVVAALLDAWRGTGGPVDAAIVLLAGLAGLALSDTIQRWRS